MQILVLFFRMFISLWSKLITEDALVFRYFLGRG